jgi:hypothetical protein
MSTTIRMRIWIVQVRFGTLHRGPVGLPYLERISDGIVRLVPGHHIDTQLDYWHAGPIGELSPEKSLVNLCSRCDYAGLWIEHALTRLAKLKDCGGMMISR